MLFRAALLIALLLIPRYAHAEPRYARFSIDQDQLSGPADFSYLNHPLGPRDRIFVRDGHFYRVGPDLAPNTADDERTRFFGVTLIYSAGVPAPEDAPRIAKRLRRMGCNLVRYPIGHILTKGPLPSFDPAAVERVRCLLRSLKQEGIYLDLIVDGAGFLFRPAVDKVPPLPGSPEALPAEAKLYMFYPRMVALQAELSRKSLEVFNLKGDPQLAMVELRNEGSLTRAWETGHLDQYLAGEYREELRLQWNAFLRSKYGAAGAPIDIVESKASAQTGTARVNDYLLFLVDRDRAYLRANLRAVREVTDALVPVSGTQMNYGGGLLNADSHEEMDYRDNHFYIDHPEFKQIRDWRFRNASSLGTGLRTLLNIAAARVGGFPYTVSEYNQPFPNSYRSEIQPTVAAVAAFQDWDALMPFSYSDYTAGKETAPHGFDLSGDWSEYANLGQSAWLFRTGAVTPGKQPRDIVVPLEMRLRAGRDKKSHGVGELLAQYGIYQPQLAMLHPVRLVRGEANPGPLTVEAAPPYVSDTGEMTFDPERKILLLHAAKVAGVFGFLGADKPATAGAIDVRLAKESDGFASILLTSLDGKPLPESRRLLVSTPGNAMPSQPGTPHPRPQRLTPYGSEAGWWTLEKEPDFQNQPSGSRRGGIAPSWMERVESHLTLRTAARRLEVYPLDGRGARMAPIPDEDVERVPGGFRIHLQSADQPFTPWYEIVQSTAPESELRIHVTDEKGRPIPARVEVRGPGGRMYHPAGAFHERMTKARGGEPYYLGSFVMDGTAAMQVPAGKYLVVAEHGLEYERAEQAVEVGADSPARVSIRLRPWVRMREKGWWSGDVHVHHTPEEAKLLVRAEHLNLAVLTTRGARMDWDTSSGDGVIAVPPHHWILTRNYEDERRGGAWILDGLRFPLDLRNLGAWFLPGISVVRQARAQRPAGGVFPWFDIDMPIWWEVPVMMALEPADSLDVIHNQFTQYGIDTGEYWGRPYDRRQFAGREGFVAYSLGLYDRYLNLGFRLAPTAGTGSGVMPSPTGYNRIYAQVKEPFTVEKWFSAIRDGRSFITNGPVLYFTTKREGGRLKTRVEAQAREPIDRVEIVANGRVLKRFTPGAGEQAFKGEFSFEESAYSWVLARCFLKPGATIRLAQSSPVYLPGRWDARGDARYFMTWIDDLITLHIKGDTKVTDSKQREQLLSLYRRARAFYEAKSR